MTSAKMFLDSAHTNTAAEAASLGDTLTSRNAGLLKGRWPKTIHSDPEAISEEAGPPMRGLLLLSGSMQGERGERERRRERRERRERLLLQSESSPEGRGIIKIEESG